MIGKKKYVAGVELTNSKRVERRSGRVRASLCNCGFGVIGLDINSWKGVSDAIKFFSVAESDQNNL